MKTVVVDSATVFVHRPVGRVHAEAMGLPREAVHALAHVCWMLRHHDAVAFIDIEHDFFPQSYRQAAKL